jgi:SAM-dependent methyltransferase
MSEFQSKDPNAQAFWDERFADRFTPWDQGDVPQALRKFAAAADKPMTVLIPGCGSGREVGFLSDLGWDVTAIDFSPAAVAAAKAQLGSWAERVQRADFFSFVPQRVPALIYERAFLCALPRVRWPEIAARWAALLRPGGLIAGFFYFDDAPKGPPFGAAPGEIDDLLNPCFEKIEDAAVADSVPVFAGKERWQVWRRRG